MKEPEWIHDDRFNGPPHCDRCGELTSVEDCIYVGGHCDGYYHKACWEKQLSPPGELKAIAKYAVGDKTISKEIAELLFAIESALKFVKVAVGDISCSSDGGPVALENILLKYDWKNQRNSFLFDHGEQSKLLDNP